MTCFILRAYTGTGVSHSQQEKIGRGFGKNAGEWTGSVEIKDKVTRLTHSVKDCWTRTSPPPPILRSLFNFFFITAKTVRKQFANSSRGYAPVNKKASWTDRL